MVRKRISFIGVGLLLLVSVVAITMASEDLELTPIMNEIELELTAVDSLTDKEQAELLSQLQSELEEAIEKGAGREEVLAIKNQIRNLIRSCAKNKGDLTNLHRAVALMAETCAGGEEPDRIGARIQERVSSGKSLDEAVKELCEELGVQERERARVREGAGNVEKDSGNTGVSGGGKSGGSGQSDSGGSGGSGQSGSGGSGQSGSGGSGGKGGKK